MNAALFKVLYENEMLFRLEEPPRRDAASHVKVAEEEIMPAAEAAVPVTKTAVPLPPEPARPQVKPAFPALKHKILILTDEPSHKDLLPAEAALLDNILKAVGNSRENADLLNFSFLPGQDAREVLSEKRTHFFITFGVPLIRLHLDLLLAPYTPKEVSGIWFLLADPLPVIDADRNLKKKLWQALQLMFKMS